MVSTQVATASTKDVASSNDSALVSSQGKTSIADTVVSKIAGIATREVSGVYDVGGGASRVVGALRERIPGANPGGEQHAVVIARDRCGGRRGQQRAREQQNQQQQNSPAAITHETSPSVACHRPVARQLDGGIDIESHRV